MTNEFPDREFNAESYPNDRFLELVPEVAAAQVTLVPDGPDQENSDHGWDFIERGNMLRGVLG